LKKSAMKRGITAKKISLGRQKKGASPTSKAASPPGGGKGSFIGGHTLHENQDNWRGWDIIEKPWPKRGQRVFFSIKLRKRRE